MEKSSLREAAAPGARLCLKHIEALRETSRREVRLLVVGDARSAPVEDSAADEDDLGDLGGAHAGRRTGDAETPVDTLSAEPSRS